MKTMTAEELMGLMGRQKPDYSSRTDGYIVVNTLSEEKFKKEHIPGSINVPSDSLGLLKKSFDKQKQIIVYCASPSCESSNKAAQSLEERGFQHVTDFEGGMEAWKTADGEVKSGKQQPTIQTPAAQ